MSKYIPGNQKHLTLENRIYIENSLDKEISFKDIAKYLCKDPTTISKEIKTHRLSDWYHKGTFYNAETSASTAITAPKQMYAAKSLSAASNALPVLPATRPVKITRWNAAADWIKPPMSAMAVRKQSITVPLQENIHTMPKLLTGGTVRSLLIPAAVSL